MAHGQKPSAHREACKLPYGPTRCLHRLDAPGVGADDSAVQFVCPSAFCSALLCFSPATAPARRPRPRPPPHPRATKRDLRATRQVGICFSPVLVSGQSKVSCCMRPFCRLCKPSKIPESGQPLDWGSPPLATDECWAMGAPVATGCVMAVEDRLARPVAERQPASQGNNDLFAG